MISLIKSLSAKGTVYVWIYLKVHSYFRNSVASIPSLAPLPSCAALSVLSPIIVSSNSDIKAFIIQMSLVNLQRGVTQALTLLH